MFKIGDRVMLGYTNPDLLLEKGNTGRVMQTYDGSVRVFFDHWTQDQIPAPRTHFIYISGLPTYSIQNRNLTLIGRYCMFPKGGDAYDDVGE